MKLFAAIALTLGFVLSCSIAASADVLLLDDPLQGSTSGTFNGGSGQFVTGGWKITNRADAIYWHLPHTVYKGAAEFRVSGLNPNECRPGLTDKSELFHMYDWTYESADTNYTGYRNNPFKHFIRKNGCVSSYNNTIDCLELLLVIAPNFQEPDSRILSWDPANTYLFREEWEPDGNGNCVFRTYRDGILEKTMTEPGNWAPHGHSVRIARARMDDYSGAPLDAIFSYVKVWDRETAVPTTPIVTSPRPGQTVNTRTPRIQWAFTPTFNRYQVRITSSNSPTTGIVWDSGTVMSVRNYAVTTTLSNLTNYYCWVKLGNVIGWTDWSAAGNWFRVDTSYTVPNPGMTQINGNSLQDNNGPLLGLGWTYMEGLGFCKNDRDRFRSDVAFMALRGFNYMRILSEVPGACDQDYWYGRAVNASTYTCPHGVVAYEWPDYDQQFRDMLDIAYDEYGMRAEVTIFGGAGDSFPTYAGRQAHCQRILNLIAGREHKVMFLEVANEAWQTGFDYPQGITDLRNLCQYLTDRTSVPVAISATPWGSYVDPNQTLVELYCGTNADLATEHFERDIGTFEGGWLPVRDCWRVEDATCPLPGIFPPCSSDEPIGPGSSVNTETDPIKLISAACFAWTAKLPAYVYHTSAGVRGDYRFENHAGVNDYRFLAGIMPADLANWVRNGESAADPNAPFTAYCNGQANKYWTDFGTSSLPTGCHRNIGGRKGSQFVCYPQGILSGGVTLQARQDMSFTVYNPMTGAVVDTVTLTSNQTYLLAQGPGAYIIKGTVPGFDTTPPAAVSKFAANPGDGQNVLTWQNPTDADFWGTKVVFRTDRYPTTVGDGSLVCDRVGSVGAKQQYAHTGLTNGVWYYYSAFAYDDTPNYSSAATAMGKPMAGQCFSERFTYPNGTVVGNRSWTGTSSSEIAILSDTVKIIGGTDTKEAIHLVSCSGSGGIIDAYIHVKSGAGTNTMWGLWFDDPSGNNLARWYGWGTSARPRIGSTGTVLPQVILTGGWDLLRVRMNTTANTSEFFFNGVSLGTLSHVETGAGDSIGQVKLERIGNAASTPSEFIYLDNIVIGPAALDNTGPGPVTNFVADSQPTQVNLSWTNPGDADYAGTRIVYKANSAPSDPWDGTLVYDGTATSYAHMNPPGGLTWYAAYAYDGVMNFSSAATASVNRPILDCFSDSFAYPNGNLNGNGSWSGSATTQILVEDSSVKMIGGATAYDSARIVSCTGTGGVVCLRMKAKRGVGTHTLWNLYIDDSAGNNLARWYGMGTSARGRIGTGSLVTTSKTLTGTSVWDDLYLRIDFVANTSQFFFNGVSIGTLSHVETGAGDGIGRLRFERENNSSAAGEYVYLDDLVVGGCDVTAPTATIGSPSIPITKVGPVSYSVNFSETVYGFDSSSDVQLNSTGGATAGSVLVTGSGSGPYTVTLSSISGNGTLGISVKSAAANDVASNGNTASAASTTFRVVGTDGRISDVKDAADGTSVVLGGKALYLSQTGFGYIEELDRTMGIRVEGALAGSVGDLVVLSGVMSTNAGGERHIDVDAMSPCGTGSVEPLGLNNRALLDAFVCGLRVKAWGKVKPGSIESNSYVLTDGSDSSGIKINTPGAPGVSENDYVSVTGAAGLDGARVVYKE